VIGVEIDEGLYKGLEGRFRDETRLRTVLGDVLEVDLAPMFADARGPVKVVGNIPYKITSPLLERLTQWPGWERAILMVQEEVAERIAAGPGTKTYGVLSVAVQLIAEARLLFGLSKNSFRPVPGVDSAVIELIRKPAALTEEERSRTMKVVRAAFSQRRKTILNSLSAGLEVSKPKVEEALLAVGINPTARAETIDLCDYLQLSRQFFLIQRGENQ
jgi:16S rRNA (adenine1518-N6/adenine1519-N6)-dimethyltransferase